MKCKKLSLTRESLRGIYRVQTDRTVSFAKVTKVLAALFHGEREGINSRENSRVYCNFW